MSSDNYNENKDYNGYNETATEKLNRYTVVDRQGRFQGSIDATPMVYTLGMNYRGRRIMEVFWSRPNEATIILY